MKIVNRGFISVRGKSPYVNWVNQQGDEFIANENAEPNIYLIEEDFFDDEPLIKANFKKIFLNELQAGSDDEENYPDISLENFNDWFDVEVGSAVFDAQDKGLQAD